MGLGDFFEGAAKVVGKGVMDAGYMATLGPVRHAVFGDKDPFSIKNMTKADMEIGNAGTSAIGTGVNALDKVMQGPVKRSIEHPETAPNEVWNANREIGEAGVAVSTGVAKVGQFVYEHPMESYTTANNIGWEVFKDQLKPENLAVNAALFLTSGGAGTILRGAEGGLEAYKAYRAGEEGVAAIKSGVSVAKGLKAARTADEIAAGAEATSEATGAASKFFSGPTKYARGEAEAEKGIGGSLGKYKTAKAKAVGDLRESAGLGRTSLFQQGREYYGEQIASRFPGAVGENAGRVVAASPGAPLTGGRFAEMMYEGRAGAEAAKDISTIRTRGMAFTDTVNAVANPEKFAREQFAAHKGDIVDFATKEAKTHGVGELQNKAGSTFKNKAISTVKDKLLNNDDEDTYDSTQSTVQQPQVQTTPGMANWSAGDSGGFVATPRKAPSRGAVTTTTPSTMSGDVGPSNWYGGQNTYGSGRGFGAKPFGTTPWQKDPALT